MTAMSLNTVSNLSTEDITDTTDGSQEPLNLDPSPQNKFNIKSFLKRHALLLLTFVAIVLGKSLHLVAFYNDKWIHVFGVGQGNILQNMLCFPK